MYGTVVFVFVLQLLNNLDGRNIKRKSYPRQMIIPNKFVPMLKESALFKPKISSSDLSDFLKPKSHEHDSVTGQTRQNLMNSMGMDSGQSEGMGAGNNMGGADAEPGMQGASDMAGITGGMGGVGGEGGMDALGSQGGMGGMDGAQGVNGMAGSEGTGGMTGMGDQMNAMTKMSGMENSEGSQNPLEGGMGGNGLNPMGNDGAGNMNADVNNPPTGDPMGTLKNMLSSQGTNAALGTGSQAFGPGGEANENVVAMLNQIVGKEMPSESPVDPSSNAERAWNQLQKTFDNQKPAGVPYIDSDNSDNTDKNAQQDIQVQPANQTAITANQSGFNQSESDPPTSPSAQQSAKIKSIPNPSTAVPTNINENTLNLKSVNTATASPVSTPNTKSEPQSQNESPQKPVTKTTSLLPDTDVDEDQPLTEDMVKFLKGVKFVISQEPGNDIILGKKFTSDVPSDLPNLKEENGVMKNVVSETDKVKSNGAAEFTQHGRLFNGRSFPYNEDERDSVKKELSMGITLPGRSLIGGKDVTKDTLKYIKAANILQGAVKKLKDPIARKSTEVAIASILQVASLGNKKNNSNGSKVNLLSGGDTKNTFSDKYVEAARVLGTASKKLTDPVAKKSTEIGIASILKVIAMGKFPATKKTSIPRLQHAGGSLKRFLDEFNCCISTKQEIMGRELADAVRRTLKENMQTS